MKRVLPLPAVWGVQWKALKQNIQMQADEIAEAEEDASLQNWSFGHLSY